MDFLSQLQQDANKGYTENGAVTNISSLNPCLDFFALGAAKRNNPEEAVRLFTKAYGKDKQTALRILFYIRDVRGGQGERGIFRACFEELEAFDKPVAEKMYKFIPEYGRWDDLVLGRAGFKEVSRIVKDQLEKDKNSDAPSLLAKWLPSENATSKRSKANANNWAIALGLSKKEYRKLLSSLRKKIRLLEQDMSEQRWNQIQYDKLPSQAFRKHTGAFMKHDKERYSDFVNKVNSGEKKINTSTLTTAEVIENVGKDDDSANALWKSLDNFVPEDLNGIVVADTSGSMWGQPLKICTSLALYFAERNKGYFANKFITFSETPRLVEVLGDTLIQKLRNIETAEWGMNTNLEKVFNLLLGSALASNDCEHLPKVIYIISDMEFDACVENADETIFNNAREKWARCGLELPTVVFWNVCSRGNNLPATKFDKNVSLISGSNQAAFKLVFGGKTPEETMLEVINSDRYKQIVV